MNAPRSPHPAALAEDILPRPEAGASGEADTAAQRSAAVVRAARWLSLAGLAAAGLWLVTAPLDEGVPAPGSVVVDTKRRAVQHASGGIVRAVMVGEGAQVREGQPLLRLDDAVARANHETVLRRYLSLRVQQARWEAERDGVALPARPHLPADAVPTPGGAATPPADDAALQALWASQAALLQARREAQRSEQAGLEESRQAQQAALAAWRQMLGPRQTQLRLLRDELAALADLLRDGYAPRNRERELQRAVADAEAALADLQGQIARGERNLAELALRMQQRRSEYAKELGEGLGQVHRELQAEAERLAAARDEWARTEIRAPATGQVVGLSVQSVGAVVQPAQKLADVVPEGESLLLEVRVEPAWVDRVRAGQPVDVRFSGFSHTPQLVVPGELASLSADALADPHTGVPFYLARVRVTPAGLQALGGRQMQPGMPVEVVFRTGERSMLMYWLQPLLRRLATSMKEA